MVAVISFAQLKYIREQTFQTSQGKDEFQYDRGPSRALRRLEGPEETLQAMMAEKVPLGDSFTLSGSLSLAQDGDGHYTSPAMVALLLPSVLRTEAGYFPKEPQLSAKGMIMKILLQRTQTSSHGHRMAERPKPGLWDWTTGRLPSSQDLSFLICNNHSSLIITDFTRWLL